MHKLVIAVVLLALPSVAPAQLGRMLGDAAGALDEAGAAVDRASGAVDGVEQQGRAADAAAQAHEGVGLTELLTRQLGVSSEQAAGGAGAIFSIAKAQMEPGDFSKVAAGVPNMAGLLAAAPELGAGAPTSRGAAALGALAAQGGSVGAAAQLAGAFSSLDMGAGLVSQFVPICVQYVSQASGPEAAALLQAVLP